jgi:hypothetical protein
MTMVKINNLIFLAKWEKERRFPILPGWQGWPHHDTLSLNIYHI